MQRVFLIIAILPVLLIPGCGSEASSRVRVSELLEIPVSGKPRSRHVQEVRAQEKSNGLVGSEPKPIMPVGLLEGRVVEQILIYGIGPLGSPGCKVTIQYAAFSRAGKKIASSWEEGMPLTFTLGRGEVIEGREQGMVKEEPMEVGERREIVISPHFARGESLGRIPEGPSLILVVDLLRVQIGTCA
jgi:peptidylprolyl isomerase